MSGRLQRLAAQARRTQPALHPIVGGLFAPEPDRPTAPESLEIATEERASTPPTPRRFEPLASTHTNTRTDAEHHIPATADTPYALPQTHARDPQYLPTLVTPRQNPPPVPQQAPSRLPRFEPLLPPSANAALDDDASLASDSEPHTNPEASEDKPSALQPRPAQALKITSPPLSPSRDAQATGPQPSRNSPSHPAEDIQIHIGRIEVIAAAPPAPRAALPRRSESLDAYLQRQDRRSR